jgi:hypothetical protein
MNLSVKIDFYRNSNNRPEFVLEPQWWNKEELLAAHPFELQLLNGYKKYTLILTLQDLKDIHEQQLQYFNTGQLTVNEMIVRDQLKYVLNDAQPFPKIQLTIYEWEMDEMIL